MVSEVVLDPPSSSQPTMAAEPLSANQLPNPHEPSKPFTFITLSNISPLKNLNYLNWERQASAILEGFDLKKFADGSHPAPPEKLMSTTTPSVEIPNPAYHTWKRQDRLVYGALLPTLSDSVASLVTQTTTTAELWSTLQRIFARSSRGHKKQLKDRLRSISKGDLSVTDYMNQIKSVVDLLASIGSPMPEEDVTDQVLRGLDPSYQAVIDGINARDIPIAFDELHEKLLNRELAIRSEQRHTGGPPTALPVRYAAPRNSGAPPSWNQPAPPNFNSNWRPQNKQNPGGSSGSAQGKSNNRKGYQGKCQWCKEIGHMMPQCGQFRTQNPAVQIPRHLQIPQYPQANTLHSNAQSTDFLVDSGATHHVTSDLSNLAIYQPYSGPESLFVGDDPKAEG